MKINTFLTSLSCSIGLRQYAHVFCIIISSELNRGFRWYFVTADDPFYRVAISRNLLFDGGLLALLLAVIDIENDILKFTIGHADGQDECE